MFVRLDTTEAIFKYAELHTAQKKKILPVPHPHPLIFEYKTIEIL